MKKFLTLTLVLFLSFSTVGEADHTITTTEEFTNLEILTKGEIISTTSSIRREGTDTQSVNHYLVVRYKGDIYTCMVFDTDYVLDGYGCAWAESLKPFNVEKESFFTDGH